MMMMTPLFFMSLFLLFLIITIGIFQDLVTYRLLISLVMDMSLSMFFLANRLSLIRYFLSLGWALLRSPYLLAVVFISLIPLLILLFAASWPAILVFLSLGLFLRSSLLTLIISLLLKDNSLTTLLGHMKILIYLWGFSLLLLSQLLLLESLLLFLFQFLLSLLSIFLSFDTFLFSPGLHFLHPLDLPLFSLFFKFGLFPLVSLLLTCLSLVPFICWYSLVLLIYSVGLEIVVNLILVKVKVRAYLLYIFILYTILRIYSIRPFPQFRLKNNLL